MYFFQLRKSKEIDMVWTNQLCPNLEVKRPLIKTICSISLNRVDDLTMMRIILTGPHRLEISNNLMSYSLTRFTLISQSKSRRKCPCKRKRILRWLSKKRTYCNLLGLLKPKVLKMILKITTEICKSTPLEKTKNRLSRHLVVLYLERIRRVFFPRLKFLN
jgi:hypothetical protein